MSSGNSEILAGGAVTQYAEAPAAPKSAYYSLLDSVLEATPAVASHYEVVRNRSPHTALGAASAKAVEDDVQSEPGPLERFRELARLVTARVDVDRDSIKYDETRGRSEQVAEERRRRAEQRADAAAQLLKLWFQDQAPATVAELRRSMQRDIARIDELVERQVNAILHHERFQKLESSWRGIRWLVEQVPDGANVRIRILNVTMKQLEKDLERAIDFDQSALFQKIYEAEFGMPGGEPYGLLLGDFELAPGANLDHQDTLRRISHTAAAAFAPFICGTSPEMFGLKEFRPLERSIDFGRLFSQRSYQTWRSFREEDDSRFVAMTLPRVLRRLPHDDTALSRLQTSMGFVENKHPDDIGIRFREDVSARNGSSYLWGNAAYAFCGVVIRSFVDSGWFADIRGVQRDTEGGGLVTSLPAHSFGTDRRGLVPKTSSDVIVTDMLEKTLADQGFISLCHCKDTEYSAFYSIPSTQKAKQYETTAATMNARISAMLQYVLCVSRFTHYLKCIVRDKIGSFKTPEACERLLTDWLADYVTDDANADVNVKARRPLRQAEVHVREIPGKPGMYDSVIHLWPHYELDELTATVQLRTRVSQRNS